MLELVHLVNLAFSHKAKIIKPKYTFGKLQLDALVGIVINRRVWEAKDLRGIAYGETKALMVAVQQLLVGHVLEDLYLIA